MQDQNRMDKTMSMERVIEVRCYDRKTGYERTPELYQWNAWRKVWEPVIVERIPCDELEERCGNEDFEVEV
jgi:hypothetical protein